MMERNKSARRLLRWLDASADPSRAVLLIVFASFLFTLGAIWHGVEAIIAAPAFVGIFVTGLFALLPQGKAGDWLLPGFVILSVLVFLSGGVVVASTHDDRKPPNAIRESQPPTPTISVTPVVTSSPSPQPVVAEDWVGQNFDEVKTLLEGIGVTVTRRDIVSATRPPETVLAQSIPAGAPLSSWRVNFNVAVPPPPPVGSVLSDARLIANDLAGFSDAHGYERQEGRGGFMSFSNPATGIYLCSDRPVSSEDVSDTAVSSFEDNANFGIDHAVGSEITSFYGSGLPELLTQLKTAADDCGGWRVRPMKVPRGAVNTLHLVHDGSVVKGPIDEGDAPVDWVFISTSNVLIQVRVATEDAEQSDRAASLALRCLERLRR